DDLVGVDIAAPQGNGDPGVLGERLHVCFLSSAVVGCLVGWVPVTPSGLPPGRRPRPDRPGRTAAPSPRWPPPPEATPGGSDHPCPVDPRSSGWTSRPPAPPG